MLRLVLPFRRSRTSCSILAMATVLVVGASPAAAQSFQGEGTFANGSGEITTPDSITTNISITSPQTVIDWAPFDTDGTSGTNIVFQAGGTTATFSSASNFAVLNRIAPGDLSRPIGMDGIINSLVNGQTGGSVYFYSPSGFVLGATSSINVGSLVLSASPLVQDGNGNFINGTSVTFNQAPNPLAKIIAMPGSQISALNPGSYVAMVAPRVQHHGTIAVNGSAALVGAEAATINFSPDGLFDIQVTTGTTDAGGVAIHGDIGGPASSGVGDNHRVYAVAVPKNTALTMVIGAGSDLGFDIAQAADVVGNAVVLSAGHNISSGFIEDQASGGADANISVNDSNFTSNVSASATGYAHFFGFSALNFASNLNVEAPEIWLSAQGSEGSVDIAGDMTLDASAFANSEGEHVTGGDIYVYSYSGGDITVDGNALLIADGHGGSSETAGVDAGNGTGGLVSYDVQNGGQFIVGGSLTLSASGYGGTVNAPGVNAGGGFGGFAIMSAAGGSTFTVGNGESDLTATADGFGGSGAGGDCSGCGGSGGVGVGGSVSVYSDQLATMTINSEVLLQSQGWGGSAGSGALAGDGIGGVAQVDIVTNTSLTINGNLTLNADGLGGSGDSQGGLGDGGIANISSDAGGTGGSTLTVNGDTNVTAEGHGGSAFGSGGNGGDGIGGDAFVGGDANTFAFNGDLSVSASASGGSVEIGTGGDATGGVAGVVSNGATMFVSNNAFVNADAFGGSGEFGGDAFGGYARIESDLDFGIGVSAFVSASGNGGYGYIGDGGDGLGGLVTLTATGGDLSFGGPVFANVEGNGGGSGGVGSTSGDGFGGNIGIEAEANSNLTIAGSLFADADGRGGFTDSVGVNGGDGTGGSITLFATGGGAAIDIGNSVFLSADGDAGSGGECFSCSGIGGDGLGGTVYVSSFEGTGNVIDFASSLDMSAEGWGGIGATGAAGLGDGGVASIDARTGLSISIGTDLTIEADGYGGYAYNGNSAGDGIGGIAAIYANGGIVEVVEGNVFLDAGGLGGGTGIVAGGSGGDGSGGIAEVHATSGTIDISGGLFVESVGEGGEAFGGIGGDGFGGYASIFGNGGTISAGGTTFVDSSAFGGAGATGGNATAGTAEVFGSAGSAIFGDLVVSANGDGGDGANGGNGGDGAGGAAIVESWGNSPALISAGSVTMSAEGHGGDGGSGNNADTGGNGGAGGDGTGGTAALIGSAAGGVLDVGASTLFAGGYGGDGGTGGNGDTGPGGAGGAGGVGDGGNIQTGTVSNPGSTATGGSATFTTLFADVSAVGGAGGDGGSGGGGTGAGGNGGAAFGGYASFLARGVLVEADTVQLEANATGGNGGLGSVQGNGGNATTGGVAVESKDRFEHPTQRGTLTANSVAGNAVATGGTGAVNGASIAEGGSYFQVLNGDLTIGSVDISIVGDTIGATFVPAFVSLRDGAATITGDFSFTTSGLMSLNADNGSMTATSLTLSAGDFVFDTVNPPPTNMGTFFADSASITTGNNFVATAHFDIGSGLSIVAPGLIDAANFTIDGDLDLLANGGDLTAGILDVTGATNLYALGAINIISADVGFFSADAGTTFTSLDITSDSNIQINTTGNVSVGDLNAGVTADEFSNKAIRIDTFTGSVLVGDIVALGGIDITAGGSVTGGNVTTGDVLFTDAVGAITYGNISAGLINPQPPTEPASVGLNSATSINVGNIEAAQIIGLVTSGTLTAGDLTSGSDILGLVHGNMSIGDIDANGRVLLADSSMFTDAGGSIGTGEDSDIDIESIFAASPVPTGGTITVGTVLAGSFTAAAGTSLTTGLIDTDSEIALGANGAITTGNLVAGDFVLANGGSITTGNIDASSVAMTSTGGNITTGDVFAFGDVELDAFGDILTGDITAGSIDLFAGDDITTGDLTTQQLVLLDLGDGGITTLLFPGASITLEAGGDIATGNIDSIDGVYADAGGGISTGTIDAVDFVELHAVGNIGTGNITAGQYLWVDSGGDQSLGNLSAGWDIDLEAGGNIAFGDADAGVEFEFEADGSVNGGNVLAGLTIEGEAGGSVTLGTLTAGFDSNEEIDDDTFSVGIQAIGPISVGNVQGANRVGFATFDDLTTGSIQTGWDFFAFADGDIVTGAITTGTGDQVFMSGTDLFLEAGGGEDSDFDPDAALALDPTATDGSITINGAVNTGLFRAAAGTDLTTQAITADGILASAGGTAALNGVWNFTDFVTLESNDIAIGANGGIDGGTTGDILLISSNPTQMLIGDGLSGTGYALSNAEFGKLSGTDVGIVGRGDASAEIDMLIGDLTVTGPSAGSTIESSQGILVFATGDLESESANGVIRVVGDVSATGFGSGNAIEFYADRFELDAATGSISITSSGGALAGELGLYADRIHVASGEILDQLAANPQYSGYQEDLNAPASVQRPEGVLLASGIWIESDNLQSVLIQNTGTATTPAGFVANHADLNEDFEVAGPAGSIDLIVNGQLQTEDGTLTGVAVRDALVEGEDLTPFTDNSTINGCLLSGACGQVTQPPPQQIPDVDDSQIDLIGNDPLGEFDFGNEFEIDDGDEGDDGASSPIAAPQPLFDTRPLIADVDVDDPVSGSGNPSLLGASEADCDPEDQTQCERPSKKGGSQ